MARTDPLDDHFGCCPEVSGIHPAIPILVVMRVVHNRYWHMSLEDDCCGAVRFIGCREREGSTLAVFEALGSGDATILLVREFQQEVQVIATVSLCVGSEIVDSIAAATHNRWMAKTEVPSHSDLISIP
jgi:hypothetical protein